MGGFDCIYIYIFNIIIYTCVIHRLKVSIYHLVYIQLNYKTKLFIYDICTGIFQKCNSFSFHYFSLTACKLLIMSPLRTKGDILFQFDFFFRFFCFFSAKLVRTITFLSFQISQLYLVCGCMTIRRCVAYHNDLRGTLIFDLKVK